MNILLGNTYFYPAVGGIENYLLNVGRALLEKGHTVTVLTSRHDPALSTTEAVDGIHVRRYDHHAKPPPWGLQNHRLHADAVGEAARQLLTSEHFDIAWVRDVPSLHGLLHAPSPPPIVYIQAAAQALFQRAAKPAPYGSILGRTYRSTQHRAETSYWSQQEAQALRQCGARVVLSQAKQHEIATHYGLPPEHWQVVPPGVDHQRFRPVAPEEKRQIRQELGLDEDARVVLYVGRASAEKNPLGLLEAYAHVSIQKPSMLVLLGPFSDDFLPAGCKETLPGPVIFPGATPEPSHWYQAADCFALPSLTEGFGQVLLEAMASGLPCVAFSNPTGEHMLATAEVLGDGAYGTLVEFGDNQAFGAALAALLDDPETARRIGQSGRKRCEEHYSWATCAERLLALTAQVLKQSL